MMGGGVMGGGGFDAPPLTNADSTSWGASWEEVCGELEVVGAKIHLTVAAARDLPPMDVGLFDVIGAAKPSADPYVIVQLGSRRWHTKVVDVRDAPRRRPTSCARRSCARDHPASSSR
jgi:hypothetical protein